MGLDFSHGEAHWAYSGFMRFRNKLAKSLGYTTPLNEMYDNNTYDRMKDEPIWPLINHSDCDGNLTMEEMNQILPQLQDIINGWPDTEYDKERGLRLIESIECAIECKEPLEFT